MKKLNVLLAIGFCALITSCTVVRQGEVGVKRTFGKYRDDVYTSGLKFYNPFSSTIVKVDTRTNNMEVNVNIPSKEGLTIGSEVSILYNVMPRKAPDVLRGIGQEYEAAVILPVFRSSIADVTSKYFAKDMHTGNRGEIEIAIRDLMMKTMGNKGITIEAVLLKSIQLPKNLTKAIEEKLEAEQQALRMEFVLQEARREADRKRIQAEGERDAQKIISEGLNPRILQFRAIEAWLQLAQSPNAKVIISNGQNPMMIDPEAGTR